MGYFSNGTEGECYEGKYCANCLHNEGASICPVWGCHLLTNYDECNNPDSILHILIPMYKNGRNQKCTMFIDKEIKCRHKPIDDRQLDLPGV